MSPTHTNADGFKVYGLAVTREQVATVAQLNLRFADSVTVGDREARFCEFVTLASRDNAGPIEGFFGGIFFHIATDGRTHT